MGGRVGEKEREREVSLSFLIGRASELPAAVCGEKSRMLDVQKLRKDVGK